MRCIALLVGMAALTAGCSEQASEPEHFSGAGTECGAYRLKNDGVVPEAAVDAQECLVDALDAGTPAFLSLIAHTTEGHPFRVGYQVESSSSVVMETDWNDDPDGPDGIEVKRCGGVESRPTGFPAVVECAP